MSRRVIYQTVCNACGAVIEVSRTSPQLDYTQLKIEGKKQVKELKWVEKNEGNKGIKHYCPTCISNNPIIANWYMTKCLLK